MVINPMVGVYIPIIRIPIKGGMTIPNIATFDHGTYKHIITFLGTSRSSHQDDIFRRDSNRSNLHLPRDEPASWGTTQYVHAEVLNIESAKNYLGGGFNKLFDFLSIGG